MPETVEDAVLARLRSGPTAAAASRARAGAVIGRSFDLDLLASVTDLAPDDLSAPLAELADHFILLPAHAPGRYGFRHALICDAIYARHPGAGAPAAARRGPPRRPALAPTSGRMRSWRSISSGPAGATRRSRRPSPPRTPRQRALVPRRGARAVRLRASDGAQPTWTRRPVPGS